MNKEQILVAVVAAAVGGVWFLDDKYEPVRIPDTQAPSDMINAPAAPADRTSGPLSADGRSMFDEYTELEMVEPFEIPDPPLADVPLAIVPVRPFMHMDAAGGRRHRYPMAMARPESIGDEMEEDDFLEDEFDDGTTALADDEPEAKEIDLSSFDWVIHRDSAGAGKAYGHIELMPGAKDGDPTLTKYRLLVDDKMEFVFKQVSLKSGTVISQVPNYRFRVEDLGFSDSIVNNYWSKHARAATGRSLSDPQWRELASWAAEEALRPKYNRLQGLDLSAQAYREALKLNPEIATVKELGRVYLMAQDVEKAVMLYDWWLTKQEIDKDPEVLALRAEAFEELGLNDRARADYETSLVTRPDPATRLRLAEILLSTGSIEDARKAEAEFRRAAQDGEPVRGLVGEARALLARGAAEKSEQALNRVASPDRDAWWYLSMGAVHYCKGSLADARDHFSAAQERAVDSWEVAVARTNIAIVQAREAAAMSSSGEGAEDERRAALEAAISTADEALAADPFNYYWPLVAKAYALVALGETDRAIEAMLDATAASPREPWGRYFYGEILMREGLRDEARTQFLLAARFAPGFPDGLAGVGRAGGGESGEGAKYLKRAIELEPNYPLWYVLGASSYLRDESVTTNRRQDAARKILQKLLGEVDRNAPLGVSYLGWTRYQQGDAEEALNLLNNARRLIAPVKPNTPEAELDEWLKQAIKTVDDWMNTRRWVERFDRPDGTKVGNAWNEEERTGVKVAIKDGAAQFGRSRHKAGERPGLWREFEVKQVLKALTSVDVGANEPFDLYIGFKLQSGKRVNAEIGLVKRQDGKVALRIKEDARTKEKDVLRPLDGVKWPDDGKLTFGFQKIDAEKGIMDILINGEVIIEGAEFQGFAKTRGGKLRVEVACEAAGGSEVFARVEEVEVWLDVR
ncbi:MAG: tetratricopeptide repeat protein [Planctomycetota bacterium]|jgi:tetratricopeptide (TPR) repeat protein